MLRLEQYSEAFRSAGLGTFQQCRNLTGDQLERMGITLPGHRRRILASLNKTLGGGDPHAQLLQSERDQRLVETGHAKVLSVERHMSVPEEETTISKVRDKSGSEILRPTPREREKPVPKERQVSRMKEESEDGKEKKPVARQRQAEPSGGKDKKRDGGIDGEREKPVPKERSKFRPSTPVDYHACPPVCTTFDTSLPPVPPRSTPNCPPQRFTSPLSPSPAAPTAASPKPDTHAPATQSRSASQSSTPVSTVAYTPTHQSLHSVHTPSSQPRPQTLAIQPCDGDGGRKTSPISPIASPSINKNAPPLPPKVGGLSKGAPPIPQRVLAQSAAAHR